MRRACGLLLLLTACGGDDSKSDASTDATLDAIEEPDAYVDVFVDAPPEPYIWVASPTTLYRFDPLARVMKRIADFDCSGEPMIDLAMNAKEELFGITSESVVRIDKVTGACTEIARGALDLPYATAFIPASSLEAGVEKWVGYKYQTYSAIAPDSGALSFAGALGGTVGNFQAGGDIVSLAGGKTYLTGSDLDPQAGDGILEIDPNTGAATQLDGVTQIDELLGLAQWAGTLYVFSGKGNVYRVQLSDAGASVKLMVVTYDLGDAGIADASSDASIDGGVDAPSGPVVIAYRGAAVTTRAPTQ